MFELELTKLKSFETVHLKNHKEYLKPLKSMFRNKSKDIYFHMLKLKQKFSSSKFHLNQHANTI